MSLQDGVSVLLSSQKAEEILLRQEPLDRATVKRVKASLERRGAILHQSEEWDRYLVSTGKEAIIFTDGTMVMHTNVSASGFYEELIHYGQIRSGRAMYGDEMNRLMMEIEAKERLIRNQRAYSITNYEIGVLIETLKQYRIDLELLNGSR